MNTYRNKPAGCAILTASRARNHNFERNGLVHTCIRPNIDNAAANNCAAAPHPNNPNHKSFPATAAQLTRFPNHMFSHYCGTTNRNLSTNTVALGNTTKPGLDDTTTCQTNTS